MNKFIIKNNYLVLNKSIKETKANDKGEKKRYYTISLYDKTNDGFEIIPIFEKDTYDKYEINKTYEISIEVTFYNNIKRLKIL